MQCHEQEKLKVGIVCSITRLTAKLRGDFDHHVQQMLTTLCYNGKLCDIMDGLQSPDLDKHKYMHALMPVKDKLSTLRDSLWQRLQLCKDLLSYKHIPINPTPARKRDYNMLMARANGLMYDIYLVAILALHYQDSNESTDKNRAAIGVNEQYAGCR